MCATSHEHYAFTRFVVYSSWVTNNQQTNIGQRLGRYILLEKVGAGGMGQVYRARLDAQSAGAADLNDVVRPEDDVAVKVIQAAIVSDETAMTRLEREVTTLRTLSTRHVASVLDADLTGEKPYLVTEFIHGPSLGGLVDDHGPLRGRDLAHFGLGLGRALSTIHAAGVIHRDVKPSNILMRGPDPVVIDFGIAQFVDEARITQTGLVMGTPGYISPELLAGAAISERSDWWGWAATLVFAATGRPPFGRGAWDVVGARVTAGHVDLDGVPTQLHDILRRTLISTPHARPEPAQLRIACEQLRDENVSQPVTAKWDDAAPEDPPAEASSAAQTEVLTSNPTAATEVLSPQQSSTDKLAATASSDDAPTVPYTAQPQQAASTESTTKVLPNESQPAHNATQPYHVPQLPAKIPPTPPPTPMPPQQTHAQPVRQGKESSSRDTGPRSWLLFLILVCFAGIAMVVPWGALFIGCIWQIAARATYHSQVAQSLREREFGRRTMDTARTVAALPWHILKAASGSTLSLIMPLSLAAIAGAVFAVISLTMTPPPPDAAIVLGAALVALIVAWWGPGGTALRFGSRIIARSISPGPRGQWVAASVLGVILVAVISTILQREGNPDWVPGTMSPWDAVIQMVS